VILTHSENLLPRESMISKRSPATFIARPRALVVADCVTSLGALQRADGRPGAFDVVGLRFQTGLMCRRPWLSLAMRPGGPGK